MLDRMSSANEVEVALSQMTPSKAPCLDGLPSVFFFQHF